MFALYVRLSLLLMVLCAVMYAFSSVVLRVMGITDIGAYIVLAAGMLAVQYFLGPWIVQCAMHVRYVSRQEYPWLFEIVEGLAQKARIPMPRIGIAQIPIASACAFGITARDGRVCVTSGILQVLNRDELQAVLAHEISHLKNRDVLFITVLSVLPLILYRLSWGLMWSQGSRDRDNTVGVAIGMGVMGLYCVVNVLVVYASRIREYCADSGVVQLGSQPEVLANAFLKLTYGAAHMNQDDLRMVMGAKAFFINDPRFARHQVHELSQIDSDRDGSITADDMSRLRATHVRIGAGAALREIFSTHPNMIKRVQHLALQAGASIR